LLEWVHKALRPATSSTIPTAELFKNKNNQIGNKSVGMTWYQADACAHHPYLSQPHNHSTCKLDRKWQTCLCHAPDASTSRGLLGWHEISALYLAVTLVLSILHQIYTGDPQTGTFSQSVSLGAYNDNGPGSYYPSIYIPRAHRTFPVRSCRTLNCLPT